MIVCVSVDVTTYSKAVFVWICCKISFYRVCFPKSKNFWDFTSSTDSHQYIFPYARSRWVSCSFFFFCLFRFVNLMQHIFHVTHSIAMLFPCLQSTPHMRYTMYVTWNHTHILCVNSIYVRFFSWFIRCCHHSCTIQHSTLNIVASVSMCVHVSMYVFIQNGITHKSQENNENDIFICYRL